LDFRLLRGLGVFGALISLMACFHAILTVFSSLNLSFPMGVLSIPEPFKSIVSLYATLMAFLIIFSIASFKVGLWYSGLFMFASSIISIIAIASPTIYGLPQYDLSPLALGLILSLASGLVLVFKAPKPFIGKPILTPLEISVTALLSALQAFLTAFVGAIFPSPTGGYTHIGDTITFLAAFLFGPKIATLTGIIGSLVADFYLAYPRWYVSIIAHGAEGFIAGLSYRRSMPIKVILSLIAGFSMAFAYFYVNIFIKGYALAIVSLIRDFFGQALVSLVIAILIHKPIERALRGILKST